MSYCRWSTDDFLCDLYCYESDRGYETHVGTHKRVYRVALPPDVAWPIAKDDEAGWAAFFKRHDAVMDMKEGRDFDLVPIGLPCDGQSFTDDDLPSFLARVESLRLMGYHVPDRVFDEIREEMANTDGGSELARE